MKKAVALAVGSLVAVYGTLRHTEGNHPCLMGAPRKDDGIIKDQFRMVHLGGFPGILKETENPTDIKVEVYEVHHERCAARLDMLEGYPSFYDREVVTLEDGREAWVYFLGERHAENPPIPSGDWVLGK